VYDDGADKHGRAFGADYVRVARGKGDAHRERNVNGGV
jgi:hypothetical protein